MPYDQFQKNVPISHALADLVRFLGRDQKLTLTGAPGLPTVTGHPKHLLALIKSTPGADLHAQFMVAVDEELDSIIGLYIQEGEKRRFFVVVLDEPDRVMNLGGGWVRIGDRVQNTAHWAGMEPLLQTTVIELASGERLTIQSPLDLVLHDIGIGPRLSNAELTALGVSTEEP